MATRDDLQNLLSRYRSDVLKEPLEDIIPQEVDQKRLDEMQSIMENVSAPEQDQEPSLDVAQVSMPESANKIEPEIVPPKPQDALAEAQERRLDRLRMLQLARAGQDIGQSIAGRYSGRFEAPDRGIKGLEALAEAEYRGAKEKQERKSDKQAAEVYKQMIKEQYPNLEIGDDVKAEDLKSLLTNFKSASRSFQQSQYMTQKGDPVTFDPNSNKYINALTGQPVESGNVIRNYIKTQTDPRTGEILEVRPGIGVVRNLTGSGKKKKDPAEVQQIDYTYDMLNPNQRKFLGNVEDNYIKDVDQSREFAEVLDNVEVLVDSDISAAIPAIKRQLARSVGREVGVMTDKDVAAFSGDQSLLGALDRFAKLQTTGKMTEKDKSQFLQIVDIVRNNLKQHMESRADYHVSRIKQRIPEASPNSIRSLLSVEASQPRSVREGDQVPEGKIRVELPDGRKGAIDKDKIEQFKKDFPEAKVFE